MDRCDIGMVHAGCCPGFSQETAPGRFVPEELCTNDLERHRGPEVGINGFVGNSHATASELHRGSIFVFEDRVVLKTELGRNVRKGLGPRRDSSLQRTNRTELAVFVQCGAANLAGVFAVCFHDWGAGLAPGILVDLVRDRLQKMVCLSGLHGGGLDFFEFFVEAWP
jgi:hypothetical protein